MIPQKAKNNFESIVANEMSEMDKQLQATCNARLAAAASQGTVQSGSILLALSQEATNSLKARASFIRAELVRSFGAYRVLLSPENIKEACKILKDKIEEQSQSVRHQIFDQVPFTIGHQHILNAGRQLEHEFVQEGPRLVQRMTAEFETDAATSKNQSSASTRTFFGPIGGRGNFIAIGVAISGIPAGLALTVASDYLRLLGVPVPITFWGGMALSLVSIFAVIIVALRKDGKSIQETSVTPSDIGFNTALVAIVVSFVAALRHAPKSAWTACIIALIAFGVDYWTAPQRGWIWQKPHLDFMAGFQGKPLAWGPLFLNNTVLAPEGKPMNIDVISLVGGNAGSEEVKLDEAYFLSGIDGTRLDGKINWGGVQYDVSEIRPIPPRAMFFVFSAPVEPPDGLSRDDFLSKWATIVFVAKYNGETHRVQFDQAVVEAAIPRPTQPYPHISPIKNP